MKRQCAEVFPYTDTSPKSDPPVLRLRVTTLSAELSATLLIILIKNARARPSNLDQRLNKEEEEEEEEKHGSI